MSSAGPEPRTRRHSPRVLVVEDEPRIRELLEDVIPEMGFATTAARTAEEARKIMAGDPHEIVLLDLQLPGMDGLAFFQQLRREGSKAQVIILTAFGTLEAARQAIGLDVVDFLAKPFHLNEIEAALSRAVRKIRESADAFEPEFESDDEPDDEEPESPSVPRVGEDGPGVPTLEDVERQAILDAVARNAGNRTAAAEELGISRRKLHYRLKEYRRQGHFAG